jgi:DNA polymerase I-like protein with 3'-5' exonuclease and polymerase domains
MTMDDFADWKRRDPIAAKAARDAIKGVTFGVPGSMQPAGLVSYVRKSYGQSITEDVATQYRDKLINDVYPEWRQYLAQTGSRVHTLTGRVRGGIERSGQLFNTQFQGLAGDGAKAALWQLLRAGYRVVAFVHDEFLIELPEADDYSESAKDIERICCRTMEEFTPGVPIACEYSVANCWSKAAVAVYDESGQLQVWSPAQQEHQTGKPDPETPDRQEEQQRL